MDLYIYYLHNHQITFDDNLDNLRQELQVRELRRLVFIVNQGHVARFPW